MACEAFIMLNDAMLEADNPELYPIYLALAEGALKEKEFAAWLRRHIKMQPGKRVQEPRARKYRARG